MKDTLLYEFLNKLHKEKSLLEGSMKSGFLENLSNIILVPILGIFMIFLGIFSSLLLPLFLIKDFYDFYCHVNKEKIAKKLKEKEALLLKVKIKSWINYYEKILNNYNNLYYLQKITYKEEKPGSHFGGTTNPYHSYQNRMIISKEILHRDYVKNKHLNYKDFILEFFMNYNKRHITVSFVAENQICDLNRRRSFHDIYLITKFYYKEVTFIQILSTIIDLINSQKINAQYCSTVERYVFYPIDTSNYNNFNSYLELSREINFKDLKNYIENEK